MYPYPEPQHVVRLLQHALASLLNSRTATDAKMQTLTFRTVTNTSWGFLEKKTLIVRRELERIRLVTLSNCRCQLGGASIREYDGDKIVDFPIRSQHILRVSLRLPKLPPSFSA